MNTQNKVQQHVRDGGDSHYICQRCGVVKGIDPERVNCPGTGRKGYDVWLYHVAVGWWLELPSVPTLPEATEVLQNKISMANCVAGAVVPAGNPFGLFIKN